MPLYGSQLWDLSHQNVEIFFTAWRKCIRRLWGIPYRTHCRLLHHICDDRPVDVQLYKRVIKFFNTIIRSDNKCVSICGRLAIQGSRSSVANSLTHICQKYGINKFTLFPDGAKYNFDSEFDSIDVEQGTAVRNFVLLKDNVQLYGDAHVNANNVNEIITQLCTE